MPTFGLGTGSTLLGGTSAITSALQSRRFGDSVSPLSQVSGSSPQGQRTAFPPIAIPSQMPNRTPVGGMQKAPTVQDPESEIIVKALIKRLNDLGKIQGVPNVGL